MFKAVNHIQDFEYGRIITRLHKLNVESVFSHQQGVFWYEADPNIIGIVLLLRAEAGNLPGDDDESKKIDFTHLRNKVRVD